MRCRQIMAAITAAAVLAGGIGIATFSSNNDVEATQEKDIAGNQYAWESTEVQSLQLKISELWRLSINSDLEMSVKEAINTLNDGFNRELLERAVKEEGEEIIDEYILSVLMGIDFELYLDEREKYESEKEQRDYNGEILTRDKIEKYLEELNESEAKRQVAEALYEAPTAISPKAELPESGIDAPNAESVLPENPAEQIRRETEEITSRAFGGN